MAAPRRRASSSSVSTRLYEDAARRRQKRESEQKALRDAEFASHPFKPTLNAASEALVESVYHRPLHDRIGEIQRVKDEKLSRLKVEQELGNPNLTFHPTLVSRRSLPVAPPPVPIAERSMETTRKLLEKQRKWQEEQENKHSFKPEILERSRALVSRSANPELAEADFLQRQIIKEREKRAKIREMESMDMAECTFRPQTYNADEYLIHHRPSMLGETVDDRVTRLSTVDADRITRTREAIKQEHYSKFTYRPAINSASRAMSKSKTVEELTQNDRAIESRARIAADQEAKFREQHTFHPKLEAAPKPTDAAPLVLNPASEPPDAMFSRIQSYLKSREDARDKARREQEYEALKACTFQPQVPRSSVKAPEGPVVVRGLGRFMETKEQAKRLQREAEERERVAFSVRLPKREPGAPIVCQPFTLSCDARVAARQEQCASCKGEDELKECTFRPATSEARNRELLMRLLAQDDGDDDDANE